MDRETPRVLLLPHLACPALGDIKSINATLGRPRGMKSERQKKRNPKIGKSAVVLITE